MLTKSRFENPYTLLLQGARQEYRQIYLRQIWNANDVCRLEELHRQIDRLKLMVRIYDATH